MSKKKKRIAIKLFYVSFGLAFAFIPLVVFAKDIKKITYLIKGDVKCIKLIEIITNDESGNKLEEIIVDLTLKYEEQAKKKASEEFLSRCKIEDFRCLRKSKLIKKPFSLTKKQFDCLTTYLHYGGFLKFPKNVVKNGQIFLNNPYKNIPPFPFTVDLFSKNNEMFVIPLLNNKNQVNQLICLIFVIIHFFRTWKTLILFKHSFLKIRLIQLLNINFLKSFVFFILNLYATITYIQKFVNNLK